MILWDSSVEPPVDRGLVYRWNGRAEQGGVHSLLRYVEVHGERLRRKYLAWIHQLGESRIAGTRLIDHLALEPGLSFWWMTLLVEKNLWKSPSITDAIRIFALEEILLEHRPRTLLLVSANRSLHEVLSGLCQDLGVGYQWERCAPRSTRQSVRRRVYRALPPALQALVSLVLYVRDRWPLRKAETAGWFEGDRSVLCCSYFVHLDRASCADGTFYSHHWEGLPRLLRDNGYQANWLQHYSRSSTVPGTRIAVDWVRRFNRNRQENGFHTFLDAFLSWHVVGRVLTRWLKLNVVSRRLRGLEHACRPHGTRFSLWPLVRADWHASICGPTAVSNLLWVELFDTALRRLPTQKRGLYLSENQAWERAFIHAWRKHGHGQLVAVTHSTVRFWDLRFYTDPRTLRSSDAFAMPQADLTALNGKTAIDAYRGMHHPEETIVECEALRYGYLNDLREMRPPRRANGDAIKVLILGDYLASSTIGMLQLLEAAVPRINARVAYTVKPHPSFMVGVADYPSLHLDVVKAPLGSILNDFDVAYSSNVTSAAVDASLAGVPVVVMLDETELNVSPLRGRLGVRFVSSPEELADALQNADQIGAANLERDEFFFLDLELPRWKRLLSSARAS